MVLTRLGLLWIIIILPYTFVLIYKFNAFYMVSQN